MTDDMVNAIISEPYNKVIEDYVTVKDFNIYLLKEYEEIRARYNITAPKAADYVNRAHEIQNLKFYEDASIDEIVQVVMAIDNKNLFTKDNANLAQGFNTSFNRVVDHYLFGTTTSEDLMKLQAIRYFANPNTDFGKFLNTYSDLAINVVSNPENGDAKDKMTSYVTIFATSLNGFTNEPTLLTEDEQFNTNAQVNDYFDWYMAYNSFIAPLYPTMFPTYGEDMSEEDIQKQNDLFDLQELMISALNDPEFESLCGKSRSLGGE